MNYLDDYKAVESDDSVKHDLELLCLRCAAHLCDVQHDDSLAVLVAVATDHERECPR